MDQRFDRFTVLIAAISHDIQKIKAREMEAFGLRSCHAVCLYQLFGHPDGLTLKQLTERCDLDKAALSRYLAELQEKGLAVQEEAQEGRRYNRRWRLTPAGEEAAARTAERLDRAVGYVSAFLPEADQRRLFRMLAQIARNLEEYLRGIMTQEGSHERTDRDGLGE